MYYEYLGKGILDDLSQKAEKRAGLRLRVDQSSRLIGVQTPPFLGDFP